MFHLFTRYCVEKEEFEANDVLNREGIDFGYVNAKTGETVLHSAVKYNMIDACKLIIEKAPSTLNH